jgi:hypothetical protein
MTDNVLAFGTELVSDRLLRYHAILVYAQTHHLADAIVAAEKLTASPKWRWLAHRYWANRSKRSRMLAMGLAHAIEFTAGLYRDFHARYRIPHFLGRAA